MTKNHFLPFLRVNRYSIGACCTLISPPSVKAFFWAWNLLFPQSLVVSTVQLKDEFPKRLPTLQRNLGRGHGYKWKPKKSLFKKKHTPNNGFVSGRWLLCVIPKRTLTTPKVLKRKRQVLKLNSNWYNAMQRLMEEILHQLLGSLSFFFAGFYTSQVVQDFFHQQNHMMRIELPLRTVW